MPAYTALDLRLGWTPRPDLEVSLGLENLLDPGHVEWGPGAEFERAAFLRARPSF
ncbi:MAG TPA: TonB-dependent receptor [Burkholderiales bacterium]|nr:TonB-dependent receptor [Burkholderiales bacterium]